MDLKGSLINTNIKIYPTDELIKFIKTISLSDELPYNIKQIIKENDNVICKTYDKEINKLIHLSSSEIEYIKNIRTANNSPDNSLVFETSSDKIEENNDEKEDSEEILKNGITVKDTDKNENVKNIDLDEEESSNEDYKKGASDTFLVTADIDWLYNYLKEKRKNGEKDIPYLHTLLEGADIVMPNNETIKRNPALEARCVKLRAQQEAREYRKMTKGVDNVRMKFPEDSISYQLKQLNRQLIAIGQFIISIFAGFLFGFKGVEWMIGNLDFGFRLLLGVMCALVIALAEIYFLAKKLNEELNIPEMVQLGGPLKFADQQNFTSDNKKSALEKQHQD